jgi:hypothetical protein
MNRILFFGWMGVEVKFFKVVVLHYREIERVGGDCNEESMHLNSIYSNRYHLHN